MLSDALDQVPYPQRISTLLRLLRAQDDPGARIAELATGGPYERYLAVVAAAAFALRPIVVTALHDPDFSVRAEATRQALRLGWATGSEVLAEAPPVLRKLILKLLRQRPGSGDAVIGLVRSRHGDHEAAALLAACTPETVARLLPELAPAVVGWKVLARRHAGVVLDWVDARLTTTPDWAAVLAPVRACLHAEPARVLDLLERHALSTLPEVDLAPLAARFPDRVVTLLTTRDLGGHAYRYVTPRVRRHLIAGLGLDGLVAVDALDYQFLRMLPPARRDEVFAAAPQAELPWEGRIEVLPAHTRVREVRRVLALPQIAADAHATLRWSRYLPAAEALPLLDGQLRSADAYARGQAYDWLVGVACREPAAQPEVMRRLLRMRNEREAVWRPMLEELSSLIPHLVPAVVPALTDVTDAVIEARDLSSRTRTVLAELAYGALTDSLPGAEVTGWVLGMIARLPIESWLGRPLRPGAEHLLTATLRKRITADPAELFRLVELLENRARHVPELQDLLRRAAAPTSAPEIRAEAVKWWLDDPHTRAARVAELLREDPAAIRLAPVWREVTGYSTTLLDPVVTGPPTHVRRWTPRQQRVHATALAAVAADPDLQVGSRVTALKHLARVPVAGRELLAGFLDAPDVPIAEAALGALPWTDRPDRALPVLLGYAGGPRARVALPAAERAAWFVSAPTLLALLRGVLLAPQPGVLPAPQSGVSVAPQADVSAAPQSGASAAPQAGSIGVTSRKAAIRILARYGPPESTGLLAEVWQAPGAHPDVRAVVLTALRTATPIPWEIFTEAAHSAVPVEVRALLAVTPAELTETDRPRFAALVVAVCASPDRQISRAGFDKLGQWIRWAPEATARIVDVLGDPDRTGPQASWYGDGPKSLVEALLTVPQNPECSALETVVDRLVAHDRQDPEPGTWDHDRPARRCVIRIVADVSTWAQSHRPARDQAAARDHGPAPAAGERGPAGFASLRAVARRLASHPGFLGEGAELLLTLADLDPDRLAEVADLAAARPTLAVRLAAQLAGTRPERGREDEHLATARQLAGRTDLAGGLFALTLVTALGETSTPSRWSDACQREMQQLRRHPHPEVADAALRQAMVR
ncbi:hypothetical protein [Actinoplanes awajinensis]|uniref:hypothetical protein n=1 Tax=Actinoplanes awajinensis TaxID=135946 RepID=UPI0012F92B23|nr:hypothetical protein [Actinoplanes awajinensis]